MAARAKCVLYYGVFVQDDANLRGRLSELLKTPEGARPVPYNDLLGAVADQWGVECANASDATGRPVGLLHAPGCSVRVYEHVPARLRDDLEDPGPEEVAKIVALVEALGDVVPVESRTPAWRAYLWFS